MIARPVARDHAPAFVMVARRKDPGVRGDAIAAAAAHTRPTMTVALPTPRRRRASRLDERSRLRDDVHDRDGLAGALEALARRSGRGSGPLVHVDADAVDPLPPPVAQAGYEIALEAVSNATHHAGADRIDVRL
jgi:signal transduction histidine kinase